VGGLWAARYGEQEDEPPKPVVGEHIFFLGIIDVLVPYNCWRKKAEHRAKVGGCVVFQAPWCVCGRVGGLSSAMVDGGLCFKGVFSRVCLKGAGVGGAAAAGRWLGSCTVGPLASTPPQHRFHSASLPARVRGPRACVGRWREAARAPLPSAPAAR
jgi:hypothetical protein